MQQTLRDLKEVRKNVEEKVKSMSVDNLITLVKKKDKESFISAIQKVFVEPINFSFVEKQFKAISTYDMGKVSTSLKQVFIKENIEQGHIHTLLLLKAKISLGV